MMRRTFKKKQRIRHNVAAHLLPVVADTKNSRSAPVGGRLTLEALMRLAGKK